MNWTRIVLDGLAMCVVFNVSTALLWMIRPTAFSQMMPKEIRKAAPIKKWLKFTVQIILHYSDFLPAQP